MTDNPDFKNEAKYLTAGQCALRYAISLRHFHYRVDLGEMPRPVRFGGVSGHSAFAGRLKASKSLKRKFLIRTF